MKLIFRLLFNATWILLGSFLIGGLEVSSFYIALIVAIILGLVNALIRPVLIILTLPINILSLGLFTFIINALLVWFVSSFIQGFALAGFWPALWLAIWLWLGSFITNLLLTDD
ncbi:phage holin family protein [Candidatus Falkowbacteria bacterium]|jgi:putative membrane protein|nr:phage holin family protein [Patescibacteria group bacterium]MDD3435151.1 phage holin family protein [Patescibacteria group bacterium]MDD4466292.1 phage holin family protein [Patescibacteria group bacterium]NCU42790.1 phage holin family protein [Candidatus Falkowbacteria bacterium]